MHNGDKHERATPPIPRLAQGTAVLRRIGTGVLVALVLLIVLGLAGAVYESAAEAADVRAYPPPGQLVDVPEPTIYSYHNIPNNPNP